MNTRTSPSRWRCTKFLMTIMNTNETLKYLLVLIVLTIQIQGNVFSQNNSNAVSKYNDKYSELVAKLKRGNTRIDYKLFRQCLLKSKQYQVVIKSKHLVDSLGFLMIKANESAEYTKVIKMATAILEIDYTNMMTHQLLSQVYNIKGDSIMGALHSNIKDGLLNSIFTNSDGKTCKTAWSIVQVTEEGFILHTLGGEVTNLEMDKKTLCDHFTVLRNGTTKEYYFKRANKFVQ